tara:strand:+ start:256 stop:477 length:222 start_codon:yes stop_codon:yes gene_type:complete
MNVADYKEYIPTLLNRSREMDRIEVPDTPRQRPSPKHKRLYPSRPKYDERLVEREMLLFEIRKEHQMLLKEKK